MVDGIGHLVHGKEFMGIVKAAEALIAFGIKQRFFFCGRSARCCDNHIIRRLDGNHQCAVHFAHFIVQHIDNRLFPVFILRVLKKGL